MSRRKRAAGRIAARSDAAPVYSLQWHSEARTSGTAFSNARTRRAVDFEIERSNGRVVRIHAGCAVIQYRPTD